MESLSDTPWDAIIQGTGLPQSLLALALSRSGKKVLHLDSNQYYGGSEAAFSLDEAQEWADGVNNAVTGSSPFKEASIFTPQQSDDRQDTSLPKLSSSRSYTLSLSPHFLYTRSKLISSLISSKVFRQLEFMAVGSWWIYAPGQADSGNGELGAEKVLYRVPGNREDVFAANHISMKSKRSLMRLLRHITKPKEDEAPAEDEDLSMSFQEYLTSKFSVPEELHDPLLSLTLSQLSQTETSASYAIPRIERHLTSIGALGPGFGAVVAKYGGGAEILQVACRASAVGGGVYALDTKLGEVCHSQEDGEHPLQVNLLNGESLQTKFVFGSVADDPHQGDFSKPHTQLARSVTVVSATFPSLFPVMVEGAPMPASTVLMFPGKTLGNPHSPPVYLQVHSSDTGECPRQQSVIYGSVALAGSEGQSLLETAVNRLVEAEGPGAIVLWSLRYTHRGRLSTDETRWELDSSLPSYLRFPPSSLDLSFEDDTLDLVKQAWKKIMGDEVDDDDFMIFEDREGASDQ
ncbi:hypothetical protein PENANT_c041G07226 [Penicillium antarcticum]|uniref:Rab proteins geranylgeranyltransferase n=1 Tax=Penicillium antarcticum TaxID=416450 RepID=A0A1V6PSJ2_9EURO|nr:uncharacterized protein N7508_004715 [Penicillium antarcticum]KAJ5305700.1 hypothetical protein N7508_004715 [Penicillium antarcticum]OQD79965.1 hypothetical protein PENANT_c041G07226 [Penicillium antarcticum]